MAKKAFCMHCYENRRVGAFEYISAGYTISLGYCGEHRWQVKRKAEQWQADASEPKTAVQERNIKSAAQR